MMTDTGKRMTVLDRLFGVFRAKKPKDIVAQAEEVVARYACRGDSILMIRRQARYRLWIRILNGCIVAAMAVCLGLLLWAWLT